GNEPKFTGSPACSQQNRPQRRTQHRPDYQYGHHAGERLVNRLLQLDEARRTEYRHGSRDSCSVTKENARRQSSTDKRDNRHYDHHRSDPPDRNRFYDNRVLSVPTVSWRNIAISLTDHSLNPKRMKAGYLEKLR